MYCRLLISSFFYIVTICSCKSNKQSDQIRHAGNEDKVEIFYYSFNDNSNKFDVSMIFDFDDSVYYSFGDSLLVNREKYPKNLIKDTSLIFTYNLFNKNFLDSIKTIFSASSCAVSKNEYYFRCYHAGNKYDYFFNEVDDCVPKSKYSFFETLNLFFHNISIQDTLKKKEGSNLSAGFIVF